MKERKKILKKREIKAGNFEKDCLYRKGVGVREGEGGGGVTR
jgi:hypothetical protein